MVGNRVLKSLKMSPTGRLRTPLRYRSGIFAVFLSVNFKTFPIGNN
jgi:hypothetical protein